MLAALCAVAMLVGREYSTIFGTHRPRSPEPQLGRIYRHEYKGRDVYISQTDYWWMNGLQVGGASGLFLTLLGVYLLTPRKRQILPPAQFQD